MTKKTRFAVVDDHTFFRNGVIETLLGERDFEVVAEGATAREAVELVREKRPDVVLLDANMPGSGLEAGARIHKSYPETKVVMLTVREDYASVKAAFQAGARGYLIKGIDADELIAALRQVIEGKKIVSPELAGCLLEGEEPSSKERASVGREGSGDRPISGAGK